MSRSRLAAAASVIGGLAFFCDLALHAFGALGRSYFVLAGLVTIGLMATTIVWWSRGVIAAGWRRGLALAGTGLVLIGGALWISAFVMLWSDPGAAFSQRLTPAGSSLMALGMLVFGSAVLASRRTRGPRAWTPLLVGAYFPTQLALQLAFFLQGKDATPGPNGLLLGVWGLLWAVAGWAGATVALRGTPADHSAPAVARTPAGADRIGTRVE